MYYTKKTYLLKGDFVCFNHCDVGIFSMTLSAVNYFIFGETFPFTLFTILCVSDPCLFRSKNIIYLTTYAFTSLSYYFAYMRSEFVTYCFKALLPFVVCNLPLKTYILTYVKSIKITLLVFLYYYNIIF